MLRVVPSLLGEKNPYFMFRNCTFTMEQYKSGSCRQTMFTDFKINNSFTLENSFFQIDPKAHLELQRQAEGRPCPSPTKKDEVESESEGESDDSFSYLPDGEAYDRKNMYHHFTAQDHITLGLDLCHTIHKIYYRPPRPVIRDSTRPASSVSESSNISVDSEAIKQNKLETS